eukprot:gene20181-26918_t
MYPWHRFIADLQGSKDTQVDLERAPQQQKQLHDLRRKLQDIVADLARMGSLSDSQVSALDLETDGSWPEDGTGGEVTPRGSAHTMERGSVGVVTPSVGGTVSTTVAKITRDAAAQSDMQMSKLKEEMRRLEATQKEVIELEKSKEELRAVVAGAGDVNRLREQVAALQAQADEIASLQAVSVQLSMGLERLPQLREEVASLRPTAAEVFALQDELNTLRGMDEERHQLRLEISTLQPKVVRVERMQSKLQAMQSAVEVVLVERMQSKLQAMLNTVEVVLVERMQSKLQTMQNAVAAAAPLEAQVAELQEVELAEKVSGIEELKRQVDSLQASAVEADLLESRFASLASVATRLPNLRAQNDSLEENRAEVRELERENNRLKEDANQRLFLSQQIEALRPQVADLADLRLEVEALQAQVGESEQFIHSSTALSPTGAAPASGSLGAVPGTGASYDSELGKSSRYKSLPTRGVAAAAYQAAATAATAAGASSIPASPAMASVSETTETSTTPEASAAVAGGESSCPAAATSVQLVVQEPPLVSLSLAVEEVVGFSVVIGKLPPLHDEIWRAEDEVKALEAARVELRNLEMHRAMLEEQALEAARVVLADLESHRAMLEEQALEAARVVLADLESHRAMLEEQVDQLRRGPAAAELVDQLRRGPAAAEVVRLQARLLELQQQEVESLQKQVDAMSETGERLVALRRELALLDSDADEVYLIEMRLPDLEKAAERAPEMRQRSKSLQADAEDARKAEEAIDRLAHIGNRKRTLEIQLEELNKDAAEVDRLTRELTAAAEVASTLATLHQANQELHGQRKEIEALSEENELMLAHLAEVDGLRSRHAKLEEEHSELLKLAAETSVLNRDNEVLRMQLNVAVALFSAESCGMGLSTPPPGKKSSGEEREGGALDPFEPVARVAQVSGDIDADGKAPGTELLVSLGSNRAMDAAVTNIVTSPAAAANHSNPLEAVFHRIRVLEAEKLAVGAENEDLRSEVERLQDALEASADLASRLRGLSQTMHMIRGGGKPMVTRSLADMNGGSHTSSYNYIADEEEDAASEDNRPDFALGVASSPVRS